MNQRTTRLRSALKGGKEALSPEQLSEVLALNGPRPLAHLRTALAAWLVIGLAIWAAVASQSLLVYLVAVFVIASRQNVFGLLIHDQAHLGLGGRYGDWITNLLCAYPLLAISVEGYAQVHLAHHRDFFKDSDPDFIRKSGDEWSFPKTGRETAALFLRDFLMINTAKLIKGKKASIESAPFVRRNPTPKWHKLVVMAAVAVALTWTGTWLHFLLLWVVPIFAVLSMFVRWGAVCEHEYNVPNADMLDSTPLIVQTWWERLLMPNLNFGLHAYHHMFPGVSFTELPKVHKVFQSAGLVNEDLVFHGNIPFLKYLLGAPQGRGATKVSA